ncbi:ThuA domain-containing protein [Sphingobacterium sp. HJSM2_6]|uniref:ThuA domain-containing protein n=1 Tax=Sphingobacterium sp. HJSM2_6 TaxID=3366264 RepID=UPI003BC178A4
MMIGNCWNCIKRLSIFLFFVIVSAQTACAQRQVDWLYFKAKNSTAKPKKVVLIAGDQEYRSEESMPMLAKLLSYHHGFDAVVLFPIDPKTKEINPDYEQHIPGLQELKDADLMIIATRFRQLPDEQMLHIDNYLKAGKPVIGLRTATHAFNFPEDSKSKYKHYGYAQKEGPWAGGFGKLVLGETWISHHGDHGTEGTRGLVNGLQMVKPNPILLGVEDVWVPTDVYGIHADLKDAEILLFGQPTLGMDELSAVNWKKSTIPVAWTRTYQLPGGVKGKAFTTTMGASIDLANTDMRRLLVNASLWAVGEESKIKNDLVVDPIGTYSPLMFGFGKFVKGKFPKDYQ